MLRPSTRLSCATVAGAILVMAGWSCVCLADTPVKPASFAPDMRSRIDDNSLWGPRERVNKAGFEATGSLMQWLVDHAALPA